eukprot:1159487-Pelagomonas_calceolata.AAC.2
MGWWGFPGSGACRVAVLIFKVLIEGLALTQHRLNSSSASLQDTLRGIERELRWGNGNGWGYGSEWSGSEGSSSGGSSDGEFEGERWNCRLCVYRLNCAGKVMASEIKRGSKAPLAVPPLIKGNGKLTLLFCLPGQLSRNTEACK